MRWIRSDLLRAWLVLSAGLTALLVVYCGTPASAIVPPSTDVVTRLIVENDQPLGFQAVSAVSNLSIGGFNAGTGTWTVQADVQYAGVIPARRIYFVYRDTEGRWAIKKQ
jgi:hypothetical protein